MSKFMDYIHIPIILVCCWLIAFALKFIFNRFLENRKKLLFIDPTNFHFIRNGISFVLYTAAVVLIFIQTPGLKGIGTTLFASAGILAAIVGFASKEAFSNIVSGIFIIIFKPFRVADLLEFENGLRGTVEDITLRHTVIKDLNNKRIIVPNSNISSESIINYHISDKKILYHYKIGISYESNVDRAIELIREFLYPKPEILEWIDVDTGVARKDKVRVRVIDLYDSGVTLRADYWCKDFDTAFNTACKLNKEMLVKFKENGIEIPYPHRTLVYKSQAKEDALHEQSK